MHWTQIKYYLDTSLGVIWMQRKASNPNHVSKWGVCFSWDQKRGKGKNQKIIGSSHCCSGTNKTNLNKKKNQRPLLDPEQPSLFTCSAKTVTSHPVNNPTLHASASRHSTALRKHVRIQTVSSPILEHGKKNYQLLHLNEVIQVSYLHLKSAIHTLTSHDGSTPLLTTCYKHDGKPFQPLPYKQVASVNGLVNNSTTIASSLY